MSYHWNSIKIRKTRGLDLVGTNNPTVSRGSGARLAYKSTPHHFLNLCLSLRPQEHPLVDSLSQLSLSKGYIVSVSQTKHPDDS